MCTGFFPPNASIFGGFDAHRQSITQTISRVSPIHAARLNTIIASVQALTQGARATVTSLGRGLIGKAYDKHKIKRVDRLVSNAQLYQECHSIYSALTRRLLLGLSEVIIAIDWSPLRADQSWQLLRAAIPRETARNWDQITILANIRRICALRRTENNGHFIMGSILRRVSNEQEKDI
jgi:hypothetical protein